MEEFLKEKKALALRKKDEAIETLRGLGPHSRSVL